MYAVIYQGYVKKGREREYQKLWRTVASYFKNKCGALGSVLHKAHDGRWIAYSRWPDKKTRDAAWPGDKKTADIKHPSHIMQAIAALKDCLEDTHVLPEIEMTVMEDLLANE